MSHAEAKACSKRCSASIVGTDCDAVIVDASELKSPDDLLPLIQDQITPFFIKHNAEAEAIELAMVEPLVVARPAARDWSIRGSSWRSEVVRTN